MLEMQKHMDSAARPSGRSPGGFSMSKSHTSCCVPQCNSTYRKCTSFHTFPKDKKLRKEWIVKLKIARSVSETMRVCGLHFESSCFFLPGIPHKRRRLKIGSIPTLNLPLRPSEEKAKERSLLSAHRAERIRKRYLKKMLCVNKERDDNQMIEAFSSDFEEGEPEVEEDEPITSNSFEPAANDQVINLNALNVSEKSKAIQVNDAVDMMATLHIRNLIKSASDLAIFTGIDSFEILDKLTVCVSRLCGDASSVKSELGVREKIVLVMVKLKLNLSFNCIAVLFRLSSISCRRYFQQVLPPLAEVLGLFVEWPEKEEVIEDMPSCFEKYKNVRVVLDCTELEVQKKGRCHACQLLTHSRHRGTHTVKILIGASPAGDITFVSEAFGGRASDKAVAEKSGVLDKLIPFIDAVMVGNGLRIERACDERGLKLIRPPPRLLDAGRKLFPMDEFVATVDMARARVHVKRAMQRLKSFQVLTCQLEWTMLPHINQVVRVCAGMANFYNKF